MGDLSPETREHIERIHKAAKELAALTTEDGVPRNLLVELGRDDSALIPAEFVTEDGTMYRRSGPNTWSLVRMYLVPDA